MVDRPEDRPGHPVLAGLLALIGVGIAVGLVLGGLALAATSALGLRDGSDGVSNTSRQSMYLPHPSPTTAASGPLITLLPQPSGSTSSSPGHEPSEEQSPVKEISLSAGQTAVAVMEQIDLTGVYPGGEGAILQVQRFTAGVWGDFPVTASVSNETFATYVQTSQGGINRFRVVDTDTGMISNEVHIAVG